MCGIYCAIQSLENASSNSDHLLCPLLRSRLECRGPDAQRTLKLGFPGSCTLLLHSTVLSLRGKHVTVQPLVKEGEGALCWNGEAWKINDEPVLDNDAAAVFGLLLEAMSVSTTSDRQRSILHSLSLIEGPFAFVFLDIKQQQLYYGRDWLGRRSLLQSFEHGSFLLSSVSDVLRSWEEVPATGIAMLNLADQDLSPLVFPWRDLRHVPTLNRTPPTGSETLSFNSQSVSVLESLLRRSMSLRVSDLPNFEPPNMGEGNHVQPASSLAILFSGGLDCTILAKLADELRPTNEAIDLLNVAFENPRGHGTVKSNASNIYDACPDRATARAAVNELRVLCPRRYWRLVEISVPLSTCLAHRQTVIELMHPHDTEMDISIALALYFAARGQGLAHTTDKAAEEYVSTPRVLISGLGADELFGGYMRHATAYSRQGFDGLLNELDLDFRRLGQRNLGRDDRVISHWGREARFPYLDEDLVRWAVEIPASHKCGFHLQHTLPDPGKLVLRRLAEQIGLPRAAAEKKRAIQFGARTAKLGGKTAGTAKITR